MEFDECDSLTEQGIQMKIDAEKATEMARRFLGQYHTVIDTKAVLENEVWVVTTHLGFSNTQIRRVMIHSSTGKILGYT